MRSCLTLKDNASKKLVHLLLCNTGVQSFVFRTTTVVQLEDY